MQSLHYRSVNGNQGFFRDVFDDSLERRLGYFFKNQHLKVKALAHRGLSGKQNRFHNERLEFLGDAVFNLYVFELLMERYPTADKRDMYKQWTLFVSNDGQVDIALAFKLDQSIQSKDKKTDDMQPKPKVLSDMLEALVGAVYLDGGPQKARRLVARLIGKMELYKNQIVPLEEPTVLEESGMVVPVMQSHLDLSQKDLFQSDLSIPFPGLERVKSLGSSLYNFHYDRLQFLGHTVFRLCLTDILMRKYTTANEGYLSKKREFFTEVINSRQISDLDWNIRLRVVDVWDRVSIIPWSTLSSVFKFLLGAVYLERDYYQARKWVVQLLGEDIKEPSINGNYRNIFDKNDSKEVSREATL